MSRRQGFASLGADARRKLASRGGTRAHQTGAAHEWTSDEAKEAGRRGGLMSAIRRRERTQAAENTITRLKNAALGGER